MNFIHWSFPRTIKKWLVEIFVDAVQYKKIYTERDQITEFSKIIKFYLIL